MRLHGQEEEEDRNTDQTKAAMGGQDQQQDQDQPKRQLELELEPNTNGLDVPDEEKEKKKEEVDASEVVVKATLKRYIILVLFSLNAGNKSFQWIQIAATTTKSAYYYNVDNYTINTTSIIFLWSFIVLSWPACYIIDRIGLRKAVVLASFGTALGSVVKCFSCYEDGVWLLMIAQLLVSMSEQLIYSAPSRLASVWFPDRQVSTAVAMCILGNMVGIAIGFQLPQYFMHQAETKEAIGQGLFHLYLFTMIVSVAAFLLDLVLFDEEPRFAPGLARLKQRQLERTQKSTRSNSTSNHHSSMKDDVSLLFRQIGHLLHNKHLLLLVVSYGIRFSITDTVATLLSQVVKPVWPGDDILVGNLGFLMIIGGIVGLPVWGHYLDKLHRYKLTCSAASLLAILSYVAFLYALIYSGSHLALYLAFVLFGFFHLGSAVSSLELAIELTYPAPELVTTSLMNVSGPILGSVFVYLGSFIADHYGPTAFNVFVLGCLLSALVLLLCSRETLKRQGAVARDKAANHEMIM